MNFSTELRKPLRDCNLNRLKENLIKSEENGETPAKIPKLDEEAIKTPSLELGTLDGLVIACRYPSNIAKELIQLLKPSGNFVIFCPQVEV